MSTVKIYPSLIRAVAEGLHAFRQKQQPIDHYIRALGRNRQFGSRDRRFVGKQLYDIVRFLRWFDFALSTIKDNRPETVLSYIFMNHLREDVGIQNIDQFLSPSDQKRLEDAFTNSAIPDEIRNSFPEWIWQRGMTDYGDEWPAIAEALNQTPPVYIRVNRIRTNPEELLKSLTRDGYNIHKTTTTDCLLVENGKQLNQHKLYRQGHFEFQDMASQEVALAAHLPENAVVIDVCAGAGGKSLHFASLLQNRGQILAADKESRRLEQLIYRKDRAGARNIKTTGMVSLLDHQEKADLVLLDVPCSATGTIGRNPAAKWLFHEKALEEIITIQRDLIDTFSKLVKPDGQLIYATCSILRAESEDIVSEFLQVHPSFEIQQEKRFLPGRDQTDGFYFAVLHNKQG